MNTYVVHLCDGPESQLGHVTVLVVEETTSNHLQILQLVAVASLPQPFQIDHHLHEADAHICHRVLSQLQQRLVKVLLEKSLRIQLQHQLADLDKNAAFVAV